ncbi:Asp-tRNA(Asn)/Glu-tRNA(Gln) amidotransferase subunit GatC [Planctomycetes bacterium K23_9]|uniref:Aspartyl/glutamyl-tRNA(Asn/Gln) amidotransferase subunit C n=1 Tax=Stieleria marina TaxID=1930275 RepID=A0A517NN29_9BACT|nr:Glutamyl-tRNA(Gln) amidotransferase subunit C [Planctomycetes bacterium K23_9]
MALSELEVRKLALLARLELSDDEVRKLGPQIDSILGFVNQLSELDTEDVQPMTTALDVDNRWRADVVTAGLSNDQALHNAPSRDDECFRVPAVLGTAAAKNA